MHALVAMELTLGGRLAIAALGRGRRAGSRSGSGAGWDLRARAASGSLRARAAGGSLRARGRRRGVSTTRAQGEDEVGLVAADMGAHVIWLVVGSIAGLGASVADDGNASRVAGVVLHRRDKGHATIGKGVAVNVGHVIVDLAISPGELELSDLAVGLGRKLDGDAVALAAPGLRVAALHLLHLSMLALADRCVVDRRAAVVDDSSLAQGHGGGGEGEQHGCAGELGQRHCNGSRGTVVLVKE